MTEFRYMIIVILALVYGKFISIVMKKLIDSNFTESELVAIRIGNFFMGCLFAMLTRNIWFIVFPIILLIVFILKVRCSSKC